MAHHHSHHSLDYGEAVLIASFPVIAPWSPVYPSHVSSSFCVLTAHLYMLLVLSVGGGFSSCFELHFLCVILFTRYSRVTGQALELRCVGLCGNAIVRSWGWGVGGLE